MGQIWLVTGPPGVGKSTFVSKVVLRIKSAGYVVGGVTTSERRNKGTRVGFGITDLTDGNQGELASVSGRLGPRVGKYRVNLQDLSRIGGEGLLRASRSSELIVIDEIGPMELVSPDFRRGVRACVNSGKPILAVVHERMEDDLLGEVKAAAGEVLALTVENREGEAERVVTSILSVMSSRKPVK